MKKTLLVILLSMFLFQTHSFSQNYQVQVGAFLEAVPSNYFSDRGVENVYMSQDHNGIIYYFAGKFNSEEEANAKKQEVMDKGFENARVIDLVAKKKNCENPCFPKNSDEVVLIDGNTPTFSDVPRPTPSSYVYEDENMYIRAIFFDFDKYNLREKSKRELDNIKSVMEKNPNLKLCVYAHTDAKGSIEYNERLSKNRANSALNYLKGLGIDVSGVDVKTFGESKPIAKNATTEGTDSPEGRQYNRRVVFALVNTDGEIEPNVVEPINVPDYLRI